MQARLIYSGFVRNVFIVARNGLFNQQKGVGMERLTSNKPASDMNIFELAYNSCYTDEKRKVCENASKCLKLDWSKEK